MFVIGFKPAFLAAFFSAAASMVGAEKLDCEIGLMCGLGGCSATDSEVLLFDRTPGLARMDFGSFIVDMEELTQDRTSRRDWLINGTLTGHTGLVTVYENGSLVISEHSQDSNGDPITSVLNGTCERAS